MLIPSASLCLPLFIWQILVIRSCFWALSGSGLYFSDSSSKKVGIRYPSRFDFAILSLTCIGLIGSFRAICWVSLWIGRSSDSSIVFEYTEFCSTKS